MAVGSHSIPVAIREADPLVSGAEGAASALGRMGEDMQIKTWVAGALIVSVFVITGASSAFAGEVTGPPGDDGFATGEWNPIAEYVANSICAFSGLNAYHPGKEGAFAGHVQSYGAIVSQGGKDFAPSPGEACNGHSGELAGEETPG